MLAEEQRNPRKRDKDGRTGLHYVCGRGKARAINGLINYGARINAQDADGYTPLHIAAGYQYVETVAQLLEAGADPDLEDGSGRTPLQLIQVRARVRATGQPARAVACWCGVCVWLLL